VKALAPLLAGSLAVIAAMALLWPQRVVIAAAAYLPLHTAMETLAVVVACLIFTAGVNSYRTTHAAGLAMLSSAFLAVGLLEFAHLLAYPGMPDFVTPSGPEKATWFWLAARLIAALGLLAVAIPFWPRGVDRRKQVLFLAIALILAAFVYSAVLFHPLDLPAVMDGEGEPTPFVRALVSLTVAIHTAAAVLIYRRRDAFHAYDVGLLLVAIGVMGLGELFFAAYRNTADARNLLGHGYQVVACYLLYRAVFAQGIRVPYRQLVESERSQRASEERYRLIVETLAEGIWLIDQNKTTVFANQTMAEMLGVSSATQMIGYSIFDFMDEAGKEHVAARFEGLRRGSDGPLEFEFRRRDGREFWASLSASPIFQDGGYLGTLVMATDITDRVRADGKIAELQYRNEIILNAAGDGICGLDESGGILFVNPAGAAMLGYAREELFGKPLHQISHHTRPDGSPYPVEQCPILGSLKDGAHFHEGGEYFLRKDGSRFPVEYTCTPISDPATNVRMVVIFSDISVRKQAEEALRQSEAWFRTLFGSIQDAMFVVPIEPNGQPGKFIEVNEIACRRLGYSRQEFLGMTIADVDDPEAGIDPSYVIQCLMAGESVIFQQVHVAKDGRRISVEVNANPFVLNGSPVVMSLVRDITERKRMEAALRASEERFRNIFEQAEIGMVQTALDGRFMRVNRKFCAIIGYSAEELDSMTFREITSPEDLEQDLAYLKQVANREIDNFSMEKRYFRKDGSLIWINLSVSPLRNEDGSIKYFIGAIEDISGRKEAQQRLHELSAHLQTVREEEKASIARELHDDLGGTLTALKMDLYWLSRKLPAEQFAIPLIERMESMSQLLDNAVGVTRRIITELRPTILDDLGLLAAIEWQADQFRKRTGIECRVSCAEDQGQLDKRVTIALFRIFQEALTNVLRHSGASRVDVEFRHDHQAVSLVVRDNGRGLGDPLGPAAGHYGIRGMFERAASLGGEARVDGRPGEGLTVTTILPLSAATTGEAP